MVTRYLIAIYFPIHIALVGAGCYLIIRVAETIGG
jgi:hypothetical protein